MSAILELNDVRTYFPVRRGLLARAHEQVRAVDGVTLSLAHGEVLGLVGESGCGKSTLARTIVQAAPVTSGQVVFEGQDLGVLRRRERRGICRNLQMIFQDPYASLNPRMTVFDAIAEPMRVHGLVPRSELAGRVATLMERVGLARRFMRKYPHEFSGGQRQRIAIARALALEPKLILADEPVSALDVSVQAQIINLIADLCRDTGLSLIFISHDLSVVRHLADRVAVMYLGRIVEVGATAQLFSNPRHPYTRALLSAVPDPDPERERTRERIELTGELPSPIHPPSGCAFHPRCSYANASCSQTTPELVQTGTGNAHQVACIRSEEI